MSKEQITRSYKFDIDTIQRLERLRSSETAKAIAEGRSTRDATYTTIISKALKVYEKNLRESLDV